MEYINKIELVGKVGSVHTTKVADKDITTITLMTQEVYKANDEVVVECCWHKIVFFGKVELAKGDSARVVGRLKQISVNGSVAYEVVANLLEKVD